MIKQAVILAGGMGTRLKDITKDMPKGFLEINNIPIVEQSIEKLVAYGVEEIIIGTGHCSEWYEKLAEKYPIVKTVKNEDYQNTSSMGTLNVCSSLIKDDFLLLESDLIYDEVGLKVLINDKHQNVILASGKTNSFDEVYLDTDNKGILTKVSKNKEEFDDPNCELVGITKISKSLLNKMIDFYNKNLDSYKKIDYENVLEILAKEYPIYVHKIEFYAWAEIDDERMFKRACNEIYPHINENEKLHNIKREVLLNPGPSTTKDSVKYAQVCADICPRELEFGEVMEEIEKNLIVVNDMIEKPDPADAPTNLAIIGRYILTPDIFEIIKTTSPGKNGEIQITDALLRQAKNGMVLAYKFEGQRFDCGSIDGFVEATNFFYGHLNGNK